MRYGEKSILKIFAIVLITILAVIGVVNYCIYLFSYHSHGESVDYCFGPTDEYGGEFPSFLEEEINPETGMAEVLYEMECNPRIDKAVITIKGEIISGLATFKLIGDNEKVAFEITLEPGVEYNESFEVYDVGNVHNEYFEFEPGTMAEGKGILIGVERFAKGTTEAFGD